jgi:L-ascorbate metabolism protein UlaG (beta-lactamase superfamily)
VDVALVPVGGGGTMDAYQAAEAVRMITPKHVMPIHFEWNASPQKALDDFMKFCQEKNPDIPIIRSVAGEYVNI